MVENIKMLRSVLIKSAILAFFIITVIGVDFYIKEFPVPIEHSSTGPATGSGLRNLSPEPLKETIKKEDLSRKLKGKININTATTEELALLPGIGEKIAEEIITFRKENGFFRDIEKLLAVKGIGEKRLEEVREFLILDGETTLHYKFE